MVQPTLLANGLRIAKKLSKDNDYALSLMIGKDPTDDRLAGFLMPVWDQISRACELIQSDPKLANGYHGLGFSQGGQFLRAVVSGFDKKSTGVKPKFLILSWPKRDSKFTRNFR